MQISYKRKEILRLTLQEYKKWAAPLTEAFDGHAKFLNSLRFYTARDLPYHAQLAPLAAILAALGNKAEEDGVRAKIARWFWCGVFGELYGGGTESRFAKDLPEVLGWIGGGPEPSTITDANFAPARLLTLRTRNSAAYKGIYTLLLRDGALDFRTGYAIDLQSYFDESIDVHHIFPQAWCKANSIDAKRCDSIVNKTPISAETNRMIGGNAPTAYLAKLQKNSSIDVARMDEILRTHVISPEALRAGDFDKFFESRTKSLLDRIEKAMGKPIARDVLEMDADTSPVEFEAEEAEVG